MEFPVSGPRPTGMLMNGGRGQSAWMTVTVRVGPRAGMHVFSSLTFAPYS